MANIDSPQNIKEVPLVLIKNVVTLATSGFGVVVALAWNEAIKAVVETYISPFLGNSSGVISLFIYALVVTVLAVFVTMQLAQMQKTLEDVNDSLLKKAKKK